MAFYLKAKKLDFSTGKQLIAMLNESEAANFGIHPGDKISIIWRGKSKIIVEVNITDKEIKTGYIGLYKDIWKKYPIERDEITEAHVLSRPDSIVAIKKRLFGKTLNYDEIDSIIKDIVSNNLSNLEIAYFVASSFFYPSSNDELYFLTKSIANNGEQIKIRGLVADKHSVGGIAGNRTSMIIIPIIASLGLKIPKTSSRAITSPAGTADTMEVLAPVTFSSQEVKEIVKKTGACLVWGGGLNIAPADDRILKVTYPLSTEPYDKMLVSIMAKKVACDVKYLIIDMPVGPTTKIPDFEIAKDLKKKFEYLAEKFGIKILVNIIKADQPIGRGVGPALEARDVLRVLQQTENRPLDLEKKSIVLAGKLLELCNKAKKGQGYNMAKEVLTSGKAWKTMQKIIAAQGGNSALKANDVTLGAIKFYVNSNKSGKITFINNKVINDICRILGAPNEKFAGIYMNKMLNETVKKDERIFTLYASNQERMTLAKEALKKLIIFKIQ
jgi:AMP phosphorylase